MSLLQCVPPQLPERTGGWKRYLVAFALAKSKLKAELTPDRFPDLKDLKSYAQSVQYVSRDTEP